MALQDIAKNISGLVLDISKDKVAIFDDPKVAFSSKSPFRLSDRARQIALTLKNTPEQARTQLHYALLRDDWFRWKISTHEDVQFVANVLNQHKTLRKIKLSFAQKSFDLTPLTEALSLSTLTEIELEDSVEFFGGAILSAIEDKKGLKRFVCWFSPEKSDFSAFIATIKGEDLEHLELRTSLPEYQWNELIPAIQSHKSLKYVYLVEGGAIGEALKKNTSIEELVFERCNEMTAPDVEKLVLGLKGNSTLQYLKAPDFAENAAKVLFSSLAKNQIKISRLEVNSLNIKEEDVRVLSEALKTNTTLRRLQLGEDCSIDDVMFEALYLGLYHNKYIEELAFSSKVMTDDGADTLWTWILQRSNLKVLEVGYVPLRDVQQAVKLLNETKALTKLSFSSLKLSSIDLMSIYKAMAGNRTVQSLTMAEQHSAADLAELNKMMQQNSTLRHLSINYTSIDDVKSVCEGLKTNKTLTRLGLFADSQDMNLVTGDMLVRVLADMLQQNRTLEYIELDIDGFTLAPLLRRNREAKVNPK